MFCAYSGFAMNKPFAFFLLLALAGSTAPIHAGRIKPTLTVHCPIGCAQGQDYYVFGADFDPRKAYRVSVMNGSNSFELGSFAPDSNSGSFTTITLPFPYTGQWTFEAYAENRWGTPTHSVASTDGSF